MSGCLIAFIVFLVVFFGLPFLVGMLLPIFGMYGGLDNFKSSAEQQAPNPAPSVEVPLE